MLERLFIRPQILRRHQNAPYREERERYLEYCEQQGYSRSTLIRIEQELLCVAKRVRLDLERGVTLTQVREAAPRRVKRGDSAEQPLNGWHVRILFIQAARCWLRFLGCWREPKKSTSFDPLIDDYRSWMDHERGFTPATMRKTSSYLMQFLLWYEGLGRSFSAVCLEDVDAFLASCGARGDCRKSVSNMATALRIFFRYAGSKGWCSSSIACEIRGPRLFSQERLPFAPSWQDVQRLIARMETDRTIDIRDKAIVMLFAIYGFRASEVAALTLDGINWEQSLLSISRVKRREKQTYPLIPIVGNAIIRYLREIRPRSPHREVFLTLLPPFRPLTAGSLYHATDQRIRDLGISIPHKGPHSLRHACATHLMAEGLSLKEIGDHLGHRSSSATRIYAKVDLAGLREIAAFDLGALS